MRRALYLHRYCDPAVALASNYMEIKCPVTALFRPFSGGYTDTPV